MKNTIFMMLLLSVFSLQLFAQKDYEEKCTSCKDNKIDYEKYASALGTLNRSLGNCSFASGTANQANGNYSHAFGEENKTAGSRSFAAGYYAYAFGGTAFALGQYVQTSSTGAFAIGKGYSDVQEEFLLNSIPNSLMIGFKSTKPTFFVSTSQGGIDKTGRIGIGNVTDPQEKLHIRADNNEDAAILLEPTSSDKTGKILFGNNAHLIYANSGSPLTFESDNSNGFFFNKGNVGIGTSTPSAKLQVANGDIFIEDIDYGIIMKSPDGQCWRGQLDNSGTLNFSAINCNLITGNSKVKNYNNISVKVYPNPTKGNITVKAANNVSGLNIQLFDISGFLVFSRKTGSSKIRINTKHLAQGNYIIKVFDPDDELIYSGKISVMK